MTKVKLGDYVSLQTHKVDNITAVNTSYVSTENLQPNKNGVLFPAASVPSSGKVNFYDVGDILVSNIRPYFKKIWMAINPGTHSSDVLNFRTKSPKLTQEYLYIVLESDSFFDYVTLTSKGTKMPRGDKDAIMDFEFPLPSLDVQQKLSNTIMALERKILMSKQVNDNLFELSKILFEAVLEDDRSELTNLANLTDIQNGFAFKSREYIGFSDTPIVRTLNIGADNLFDMQNLKYISDESRTKYQKFEFKTFDTALVMVGGSIGKTGFVTSRTNGGLQNQNMWRFRPLNSEMPGLYIYNLVTYANSQMQGYKTGSAREFYTKDAFKNFEVPVGNADIYKAFFAIQDLLDNNASQTTTLTAMREEILTQVMA